MGANVEQKNTSNPREFVVTTFGSRPASGQESNLVLNSGVWNGKTPYGLGYPVRWVLERTNDLGARIRRIDGPAEEVIIRPLRSLDSNELAGEIPIELEAKKNLWITLRPVFEMNEISIQGRRTSAWVPKTLNATSPNTADADKLFRHSGIAVLIASLLALLGIYFIPKGPVGGEGLIPDQYAGVLLSPALKSAAPKAKAADSQTAVKSVVQAFQSKAVQKTTQSLFNPAAAKALLNRTSLLDAGSARLALRGVLNGKSKLSENAGTGGLDLKEIKGAMPLGGSAAQAADYRGGAATTAVSGHGGLAAISYEAVNVSDGLTKDEVGKVIREHLGQVRYCYESALARSPGLEGKLLVGFTVGADGTVKDTQTKESSGNPGLDQCIQSRLLKWKFPKPRNGVDIGVTYPFIFKSLAE